MKSIRELLAALSLLLSLFVLPVHAAPGDLDPLNANVLGNVVLATSVQPDGKTIIAGQFSSVLGVPRQNIARLNANGTLDMGFDPKANSTVNSVAVQADGKILLGGDFTALQPNGAAAATPRQRIARVNSDGTLDTGFDPKANGSVLSVAVQADGKILLGGGFTTLQTNGAGSPTTRNSIARVNANGTLDTGFNPNANTLGSTSAVHSVVVQADGRILLGGDFTTLQPNGGASTTRNGIARVNANGTLDVGFDPNADRSVFSVAVQADGKILLGGLFATLQPNGAGSATTRNRIARVNVDGTLDSGFDPNADRNVYSLAVQADGKVLLGGAFTTLQPNFAGAATTRNRIARVHSDGTLDLGFNPNANGGVYSVAVQADGKVLLGGLFTTLQPNGAGAVTPRNFFARLVNDAATQSLTNLNASGVQWLRGGASPEVQQVSFELSTDGGTSYSALGAGTRIIGGWERTGLALPGSGHIRARGRTAGGGMVETVVSFSFPEISVLGNNVTIIDGDTTPSATDHTDFGGVPAASGMVVRTFTVHNSGNSNLAVSSLAVSGTNASNFTVGALTPASPVPPSGSATFTVTFNPNALGARTATITVNNNDNDEAVYDFAIQGTGTAPEINVQGNNLTITDGDTTPSTTDHTNFGGVPAASGTVVRTFTVQNTGTANLTLGGVTVSGVNAADFTVSLAPASSVVAAGSTTFQVTFDPAASGLRTASLSFSNNDTDENPFNFSIQGTGTAPEIAIEQPVGTPLGGSVVAAWGWNNYGQTTVPGGLTGVTVIAAGTTHTVAIKTDGSVVAWGDNSDGQTTVPAGLSGVTAIAAGGSHTVALKSDGSVVAWGRNEYGQTTVPGGLTGVTAIAAGANHTVALKSDGSVVAWGWNDDGQTNVPGGLTGVTAIAAGQYHTVAHKSDGSVVAWGYNAHGQTTVPEGLTGVTAIAAGYEHTVALGSDGSVVAWGSNDDGQTTVPGGLTGVKAIAAGAYHTVALKSDGSIVAWGNNSQGQTTVPGGLPAVMAIAAGFYHTVALTLPAVGFGSQAVATTSAAKTFSIKNTGPAPLTISSVSVIGGHASDFTVNTAGMLTSVPAVTGQTSFAVTFTPSAAGARQTTLRVVNNDSDEGSFDVVLTGTGIVPEIVVLGNSANIADGDATPTLSDHTDFGSTTTASGTLVRTFTVQNTGTADLTVSSIVATGAHAADFTVGALSPASPVPPSGNATFTVTFDPSATGTRTATLTINNNDSDEAAFDFAIQGTGGYPEINVQGNGVNIADGDTTPSSTDHTDFGSVTTASGTVVRTFTLQNTGDVNLTVDSLAVSGTHAADFTLGALTPASPVAPSSSATFTVTFDPSALGTRTATLTIYNNDSDEAVYDFAIQGTGTAPEINLRGNNTDIISGDTTPSTTDHTDFGSMTTISGMVVRTFTVQNTGTAELTLGSVTVGGTHAADFVVGAFSPASPVPPSASTTFTVIFDPSGTGARTATIVVNNNDSDEAAYDFAILGTGTAPEIAIEQPAGIALAGSLVVWGRYSDSFMSPPVGLTGVTAIAAGNTHTVALKSDGSVVAWGSNNLDGQATVPVGLTGVTAIAAGGDHTVALKSDGSVVAWGRNSESQTDVPVGLTGVRAIAAGSYHTVALKSDGSVVAWGFNFYGQTTVPVGLTGVTAIAAGGNHTVALKSDGSIVAWGRNNDGQTNVPFGLTGVTAIAAGDAHTVALKSDGSVVAWGNNAFGQTLVPVGLAGVTAIVANGYHTVALKSNGSVVAWGWNEFGQVDVPLVLTGVTAIAAGAVHTLALNSNGTIGFGVQVVATTSAAKTFTIKNTGDGPLTISSVSVIGGHPSDFSVSTAGMLSTVPALSGTTSFTVTFTPNALGARQTTLRVLNSDSDEGSFDIVLAGTGTEDREIAVAGNSVNITDGDTTPSTSDHTDFGSVATASGTVVRTFTVHNTGTANLTVSAIGLTGTHAADFTLGALTPQSPLAGAMPLT